MIEHRGGRWRVRIHAQGRCIASRTFARRRDAEVWERSQKTSLTLGTWADPKAGLWLLEDYIRETWQEARPAIKPSTREREKHLIALVVGSFGRRPLASISPSEVAAFARQLGRRYSASTVRQAVGLLKKVFAMAVADGVVPRNPTDGVRLPRVARSEPRPLSHEQVARLVEPMRDRDRLMVLVMAYGGLRWGELAGLRVKSLTSHGLRLVESITDVSGHLHVTDLKNHQARSVPLPESIVLALEDYVKGRGLQDWLFTGPTGEPLRNQNWRRDVLTPSAENAGLGAVTPHNLRDTAASLAISAGATVPLVAKLLGHEDGGAVLLRHYAGVFADDLASVAGRLEQGYRLATLGVTHAE